jgi:two-component system response regulator PilR (NtrC family)
MNENILIVDDEKDIRESLSTVLQTEGYICAEAEDGEKAIEKLESSNYDIVITDIVMPNLDGMKLLEKAIQISPDTLIVLMTAYASIETAVSALRKGATDYLLKPIEFDEVIMRVKQLLKQKQLILENKLLKQQIDKRFDFNNIIGQSQSMQEIYAMIKQISTAPTNVLITGASGTGKELVARAIHNNSNRSDQPFIPVNCGAIPENLYESELFGYKKGSFTGANTDRDGLFKAANTGTLFLDEVGELPESVQVKLLRVLQEKEIRPVGSNTVIKIDVRILAATNKNLYAEVQEKKFREDLYYRLNVIELKLPTLTERKEDIPLLVNHFIKRFNEELNKNIKGIDNEVMRTFLQYEWKGNLRELENMIERAVLLCETDYITIKALPPYMHVKNKRTDSFNNLPDNLAEALEIIEKQHITKILKEFDWNRIEAAQRLGIDTSTLYRKMIKLSIKPD